MNSYLYTFMLVLWAHMAIAQTTFSQKSTTIGRLQLTMSNAGTIGRPQVRSNVQGAPSMAFPIKGKEHLFEAGIWIGALVDGQSLVSTSAVDAASGYATGGNGFEFTPLSQPTERSKLVSSPNYSSQAISHQDFVFQFSDEYVVVPGTSIPIANHTNPLKAKVNLESYAWNFSYADFFVILNYTITNTSDKSWDSVWVGQWSDLVVRDVTVTRDAGTAFFSKGRNSVDDNLKAVYAWLGDNTADDANFIQSYGAIQFLGMDWRGLFFNPAKPDTFTQLGYPAPRVNYNFWNFNSVNPPFTTPQTDLDRYIKMQNPIDSLTLYGPTGPVNGQPANWIQLITAGVIPEVRPGESFTYTVAFVCARKLNKPVNGNAIGTTPQSRAELTDNLRRARSTYLGEDITGEGVYRPELDVNGNGILDRYVLPEPPASPKLRFVPQANSVDIYWDASSIASIDPITRKKDFEGFRLYRTNIGDDLDRDLANDNNLIAQWDSTGNAVGFNNGFDAVTLPQPFFFEGDTTSYTFKYTIQNLKNGWQYQFLLTAFDEGDATLGIAPIESSFTENEYRIFAGSVPQAITENGNNGIGVYPNPYRTTAAWDGGTSRTRKIYFYNLPAQCDITIFTSNGDLVATLNHDAATYNGNGVQWFDDYSNTEKMVLSGGEHAWDLLTSNKTELTTGVYIFTVKDVKTGYTQTGKFAIIK